MKKFLIGCGITVLIITAVGFGASFYFFNKLKQDLAGSESVVEGRKELVEKLGEATEFEPASLFDADRFARYLEIREAVYEAIAPRLAEAEEATAASGGNSNEGFLGKVRGFSQAMRTGVGAVKVGFTAMAVRDSLLLQASIPEGEYIYYHCLSIHSWLEWSPPEWSGDHGGLLSKKDWDKAVRSARDELRAVYVEILQNLADAMAERDDLTPEQEQVRTLLQDQLQQRWGRDDEWPLQGALPETVVAELEPYEVRLRATLPRTTTAFFVDTMATHMNEDEDSGAFHLEFE